MIWREPSGGPWRGKGYAKRVIQRHEVLLAFAYVMALRDELIPQRGRGGVAIMDRDVQNNRVHRDTHES